jgi:hypothetical protein
MKKIILSLLLSIGVAQFAKAQLYDTSGTKQYSSQLAPIYNNSNSFDGSYVQMIYSPTDVVADTLFGIQFEMTANVNPAAFIAASGDWEVWVGETTQSSFGQYITTGITKIFDGIVKVNGTKLYVYFDNYHIYSGTQNLVVGILENTNGNSSPTFWQGNAGTASVTRTVNFNAPGFNVLNANASTSTVNNNTGMGAGKFGRPFTEFIISEPCEVPTNMVFSNIKQNTAQLTFDSLNGNNWDISYLLPGAGGTISFNSPTSQNVPFNSLARFTDYTVDVSANCGAFGTSETTSASFTSKRCDSIHTSISESFEPISGSGNTHFTTGCWSVLGGGNPSFRTTSPAAHDGNQYIRMASSNDYLVLPELEQVGTGVLSFWANSNSNLSTTIRVGILTDPKDVSSFVSIKNFNKPGGYTWQQFTVDFSQFLPLPFDKKYIAIRADRTGMNFDKIEFKADSVVSNFVQDFENMMQFTGVNEEGWVGYFDVGGYGSLAFGEVVPSGAAFSGNDHLYIFDENDVSYLTSPKVEVTNKRLKFAARSSGASTRPIYVGTISSPTIKDTATFIPFDTINATSTNTQFIVDLSSSIATNSHIAFKLPAVSTSGGIILDLIEFGQPDLIINDSLCIGDSIVLTNKIIRNSGTYLDTLQGTIGDSIVQYNATFFVGSNDTLTVEICDSLLSPSGKIWRTAGTYYDTIPTGTNCDSLFTFYITKSINVATVNAPSFCLGDSLRVTINPSQTDVEYTFASANPNVRFVNTPKSLGNGGALTLTSGNYNRDFLAQVVASKIDSIPPNAINLGGTADRIAHAMPANLNYSQSFTVEAWMSVSDTFATNRKPFFFAGPAGGTNNSDIEFYVFDNSTKTINLLFNRSGSTRAVATWDNVMVFNQWFHIAVSYDQSLGNATLYINGVSQGAVNIGSVTQRSNSSIAWGAIDQAGFGTLNGFNDKIDQMRIWDDYRTPNEILANMNVCMTGAESDLVANFTADEATGTTITDNVSGLISTIHNPITNPWVNGGLKCGVVSCVAVIDTFNIDVDSVDVTTTQNARVLTANAVGATYQWLDCSNNYAPISVGGTNQSYTALANGSYAVEVTQNGCADTSACLTVVGVGINNIDLSTAFNLYPNPTTGWVHIESDIEIENIRLFSMDGRVVKTELNTNKLNLSDLSIGVYFIVIETQKGTIRKKLVKQ